MDSTLGHALSVLPFFQLALILLISHLCGSAMARLGQSRVIGEICAGMLLGPGLLVAFGTDWHSLLFPTNIQADIRILGEIGLVLLMFQIGLRFDSEHLSLRKTGRAALFVAAGGVLCAFALGSLVGWLSHAAIAPQQPALGYVLFCGVALSITALPVLVRIIDELQLETTAVGTISIAAAGMTDAMGWTLLIAVVALSSADASWQQVMLKIVQISAFLLFVQCVMRPLMAKLMALMGRSGQAGSGATIAVMVSVALLCAWATTLLGLHSALGGLLAGVVMREWRALWQQKVESFVNTVLVPLYFAATGLNISMAELAPLGTWVWILAFLAAAIAGKLIGCYYGGRLAGVPAEDARGIAVLMNTRGVIEIVVLSIGLDLGLISQTAFFLLFVVAVVCTLMTTPLLRRKKELLQARGPLASVG